jgi:lipopolysaccharide export system permease protein
MILERYLAREILSTTFAITVVLIVVVMSGRLSSYIADAAAGKLAANLVFPVLLARLPEYLELVLPLSLFLGVLISLIQLHQSSELTVMYATGFGQSGVIRVVVVCALFVALVVALFSFYVSPRGGLYVNYLIANQGLQNELSVVTPGKFYQLDESGGTIYAADISEDRSLMSEVLLSRVANDDGSNFPALILADRGYPEWSDYGGYYFVLETGLRYEGVPGRPDYRVTEFDRYKQLLPEPEIENTKRAEEQTLLIHQLFGTDSPARLAEINWRLSMPVLVLVLALLAQPLSSASVRRGGPYARVFPGVMLYVIYLISLNAARDEIATGSASNVATIWLVHLGFLLLFAGMILYPRWRLRRLA